MAPAVAAALIGAGVSLVSGIVQTTAGKKRAKKNKRPELGDLAEQDYSGLLDLFEQQAQYGVDPSTLNFISGKNEDALQSTLQSMLLAGGSPNSVSNAYRGFTGAMSDLGVIETEKRWEKIKTLAPITEQLADAKLQRFLYDKDAPYKDEAQAAALQQQQGYQQFMMGLDTLATTAIQSEAMKTYGETETERAERIKAQANARTARIDARARARSGRKDPLQKGEGFDKVE